MGGYFSIWLVFFLSKYKTSLTFESTEYFLLAPRRLGSGKEKLANASQLSYCSCLEKCEMFKIGLRGLCPSQTQIILLFRSGMSVYKKCLLLEKI